MEEHTLSRDEFARWVHEVLSRLYDAPYLQAHPLAEALAGPDVSPLQRSQNLRRTLLNNIRALRPDENSAAQATDRRAARILELRFVEGLSPAEAMQQLSYGRSQFYHEQSRMLGLLATMCWEQYQQLRAATQTNARDQDAVVTDVASSSREQLAQAEVARLLAQATWEPVDLTQLIGQLHPALDPLARAKGIAITFDLSDSLEVAHGNRTLLRQVTLNAITYALDLVVQGQIEIRTFAAPDSFGLLVRAHGSLQTTDMMQNAQRTGVGLEVSQQLMRAMHGTFDVVTNSVNVWQARLAWRIVTPHTLLVVDDNHGFVDLFRRYLAGHHWRVVGAATGSAARETIAAARPTVIMLDVMMPNEDGWEFLMALRAEAATRDIPVVVCSVLNEPQMALALGANGFLLKPVTQHAMLQALAPWWPIDSSPAPA